MCDKKKIFNVDNDDIIRIARYLGDDIYMDKLAVSVRQSNLKKN